VSEVVVATMPERHWLRWGVARPLLVNNVGAGETGV
jgi:hypothetical protein